MPSRKTTLVISGLAIVAIGAAIFWATTSHDDTYVSTPAPTASSAPSVAPEIRATAITAAAYTASFDGMQTADARERGYVDAGVPENVAADVEPVWFEIFDSPNVAAVPVQSTGDTLLTAAINVLGTSSATTEAVSGSEYLFAVDVECRPRWSTDDGTTEQAPAFTATWRVTVDTTTGDVISITQPTPDEIPFRPDN